MKTAIEIAQEVDFWQRHTDIWVCTTEDIKRFVELVRADAIADEREACMNALNALPYQRSTKYDCMDAIRARGNQ